MKQFDIEGSELKSISRPSQEKNRDPEGIFISKPTKKLNLIQINKNINTKKLTHSLEQILTEHLTTNQLLNNTARSIESNLTTNYFSKIKNVRSSLENNKQKPSKLIHQANTNKNKFNKKKTLKSLMQLKLRKTDSKFTDFLSFQEGIGKGIEKNMIVSHQKEIFLRKPYFSKKSEKKHHKKNTMINPIKTEPREGNLKGLTPWHLEKETNIDFL